jgi:hypothetical protein
MQPTPQDNQLMSKHRVLSFKPQLRLEWQGQDAQNETEQLDHPASLGDSITSSTRIKFSVHTAMASVRSSGSYASAPAKHYARASAKHYAKSSQAVTEPQMDRSGRARPLLQPKKAA